MTTGVSPHGSDAIAEHLNDVLTGLLGMRRGTKLDPNKNMEALGLDSLLALELLAALDTKYGISLEETAHVDHPTIGALAAHVSTLQRT